MINYVAIIVIVVLMLSRERVVRPNRIWIMPAVLTLGIGMGVAQTFTLSSTNISMLLICSIVGMGVGIWRGKLDVVRVHPNSGKITFRTPVAGIVLFVAVIALRMLVSYWGEEHNLVQLGNDMLLIPLLSVYIRRYYVYLRYKQLFESISLKS